MACLIQVTSEHREMLEDVAVELARITLRPLSSADFQSALNRCANSKADAIRFAAQVLYAGMVAG